MTREEFEAVLALDGMDLIVEESVYHQDDPNQTDKVVFAGLRRKGQHYNWYGYHAHNEEAAIEMTKQYWEANENNRRKGTSS